MLSKLGLVFSILALLISLFLIYYSFFQTKLLSKNISPRTYNLSLGQLILSALSFFVLLLGYVTSDFSLINVYENSHTTKPIFYKISGVWGNHEGSLLLWINILVIFSFYF